MKIRTLAIAGALTVLSTAFPKSTEAASYDFHYGYNAGGLAAVCDLYIAGAINAATVREASIAFLSNKNSEVKIEAANDAFIAISTTDGFKDCPLQRP